MTRHLGTTKAKAKFWGLGEEADGEHYPCQLLKSPLTSCQPASSLLPEGRACPCLQGLPEPKAGPWDPAARMSHVEPHSSSQNR